MALSTALLPAPGAGAQAPPAPFAFREDEVEVAPSGEARLRLYNDTGNARAIEVAVTPEGFTVSPDDALLRAAGVLDVVVRADGAAAGTEATVTAVVVADPAIGALSDRVVRATVTVVAPPEPPPPVAEPLADAWSATSHRWLPWGDDGDDLVVPLAGAASCADAPIPEGTLGGLASSPGAARVEATCTERGAGPAEVGAALTVTGLGRHTGDYTGEVDLAPDAPGGELLVTVRRTDHVLVPLLALLAGVGAGWLAVRRLGLLGAGSRAARDAWLLLARIDAADRTFRAQAGDAPWAASTFRADADDRVRGAVGLLAGRRRRRGRRSRPGADRALGVVGRAADAWPLLAPRLAELAAAVEDVARRAPAHRPVGVAAGEPACLAPARRLLTGRPLTAEEAVALAAAVDAAAVVCGGWLGWADRLAEVDGAADLAALEVDDLPADHADVRAVGEARALLAGAAVALWEVEGPDGLAERRPLESIADAHALLAGVGGGEGEDGAAEPVAPPALRAPAPSPLARALAGEPGPGTDPEPATGGSPTVPGPGPAAGGVADRRRAVLVGALTTGVTVWSGLALLYADRPFGTPADYAGLAAWGLVAQVALVALATTVDRLTFAPLPSRISSARG
jgi:hypothetical protein